MQQVQSTAQKSQVIHRAVSTVLQDTTSPSSLIFHFTVKKNRACSVFMFSFHLLQDIVAIWSVPYNLFPITVSAILLKGLPSFYVSIICCFDSITGFFLMRSFFKIYSYVPVCRFCAVCSLFITCCSLLILMT